MLRATCSAAAPETASRVSAARMPDAALPMIGDATADLRATRAARGGGASVEVPGDDLWLGPGRAACCGGSDRDGPEPCRSAG